MAAIETITTDIDELSSIVIAEARLTIQNRQDLRTLLTQRTISPGQNSVRFPKYANQTAAAITEGSAISLSKVTTTGIVLTPGVNAAWGMTITDMANLTSPQAAADLGRIAGDAILTKINKDIFALFDGFSTTLGSSNTDLTLANIRAAKKKLLQANAPGPHYFVFTPEVWEDLHTQLQASGATNLLSDRAKDALLAGVIDTDISFFGLVPVCVTSGISEVGDVKCGAFSPLALGYVEAWDFKVLTSQNTFKVGTDISVSSSYAVGEIDDAFGIELLADGAD